MVAKDFKTTPNLDMSKAVEILGCPCTFACSKTHCMSAGESSQKGGQCRVESRTELTPLIPAHAALPVPVQLLPRESLLPENHHGILHAMLRQTRSLCNGTQRIVYLQAAGNFTDQNMQVPQVTHPKCCQSKSEIYLSAHVSHTTNHQRVIHRCSAEIGSMSGESDCQRLRSAVLMSLHTFV